MSASDGEAERLLEVVETETAYLVTEAGDPDDWLVSFGKAPAFPAAAWAEGMVRIFNAGRRPTLPPGRLSSHRPQ